MRGFRNAVPISRSRFVTGILPFFLVGAVLLNSGCAGLVASNGGGGNPTPLTISNVAATNATVAGATVSWQTNIAADSSVDYGTTTSYGNSTPVDSAMVTSHQVTLSGLAAGTTYYYQVNSTDPKGNRGHGGNKFKTAGFSMSGTITPAAAGNGAAVALSGAASASATADNAGNYTFAGLPNGSYQVTPTHTGYAFTPGSQSTTVNGANVTGVNFTANAVPVAPTITMQPVNQTVTAGQTASFTVVAGGTAPLSYQWQKNGANIAGATAANYTTPATTTSDSGSTFDVVVTNAAGTVTSSAATLTVNPAPNVPSITSLNPTSGLVGASVTVSGANFGATQGASTVKFNGIAATPTSWSATSIVAAVPAGATTGNVVVTVGGVASNGASFTVQSDTTPPVVTITAPANNSTVSATITLTATATDPDSAVSFVQFQVDGANMGAQLTTAPYSLSLDTTTLSNATHSLTAVAQDPSANVGTSAAVTITVSNATNTAMGPLKQSTVNPHYFVTPSGKAVLLSGSQTWNDFQDTSTSSPPAAVDFTAYVNFLKSHGHNVTILWRKDLPTYCNWGAGGTWHMAPFPWKRTGGSSGTQVASDGLPAFDLTQLDQTYFDRLRARVIQLQQNGIYAIVELFDGLGLVNNRCSNDGYPFTGGNNVNGVDDGGGTNSMTMGSPNSITNYQDAFVQKVIDTLNDQPNVLWEPSEEAPNNSTWWQGHMISLIHTYEAGKPNQHPVGYAILQNLGPDSTVYNSNADWVAPGARISPTSSCGSGTPQCKVNINDSDHTYFGMWNDSAQANRNYAWENFANGNQVMFMDPYVIFWPSGNRNLCSSPVNGVCSGPDSRWNNFRDNMGYMLDYANTKLDLLKMTPQGNLSSTGHCLADNVATGAEYLVYSSNGGSFTVNLSATTRTLNVEWLNPSSGAITTGGTTAGGSANQTFTPPFSGDAVLYLVDVAGHN